MKFFKIIIINLMLILLSLFILLGCLEIFVRLFEPNRLLTPGTYISHPTRRYTLRPNFSGKTYGQLYKINSYGFRDYEYDFSTKKKGTFKILCVGDSFTFGVGIDLESTYPKQLEKLIQARFPNKKIELINCGVPSYNTYYEYLFLKEEGLKYNPDLIIIIYVYNDSNYNRPLTPSRYKFINIIKDMLRRLHSYEFIIEKVYRVDHVFKGLASPDPKYRLEGIKSAFSDNYIGWQKNKEAFRLLADFSRNNRIPIVYVIFPKLESLEKDYPYIFFHEKVRAALENQPYVLDLLPYFEGRKTKSLWAAHYESHPNRAANAISSEAILDFLMQKKLIP